MDDRTIPPDASQHVGVTGNGAASLQPAAWAEVTFDDEPTLAQRPRPLSIPSAVRSFVRRATPRGFMPNTRQTGPGGRRRGMMIAIVSGVLLLVLAIPVALEAVNASRDYTTLKGLGQSGLAHLLAVKDDLTGAAGSSSSSASTSTLGGSGKTVALLASVQAMLATPGLAVKDPAYTYLAQRQSGTFYPLTVTVQPAKGVSSEGSVTKTFQTTLSTSTAFTLGGQPVATPTATSATPAPTTTKPTSTPSGATASASGGSKTSNLIPDQAHIAAAERDLRAAQSDFQGLADRLDHPDSTLALVAMFSVGKNDLDAAKTLAYAGVDVTQAGLALLEAATPLLTRLHGSTALLAGNQKLITQADITALQKAMTVAAARLEDASKRLGSVDVNALPLSAHQKALFAQVTPLLPQVNAFLPQASDLLGIAGWLLGTDQSRHFLVQTLDRGEMRASGGFTGQYGVLTLTDGKLAPFSLQDVNCLDYLTGCLSNGWIFGRRPPHPYDTWWPFGNWGLRDSNLSADFPTDARLVMDVYYHESGQKVDGLIDVSPIAIEDVLRVTGPIQVPLYGETVTADNLEAKLHYYQQDPTAIAKEKQISGGNKSTSTRKQFTQLVGQLLQERVKSLPMSQMLPLAQRMLLDMRSKDLEIYFSNPKAEQLLAQLHADSSVDTTPGTDGFLLAQSNTSVSKATSFVKMTQRDNVTLDAKGGATHHLTLTFSANYTYNQVYGYLTYRDYLRIYVPPQSKLLGGDGWDSGQPMCWTPYSGYGTTEPAIFKGVPLCAANPYPQGELVCPSGGYGPGPQAPNNPTQANPIPSDGYTAWALDQLGAPPNTTSDLPNRAMYAGYVVVPDHCTATVTVSWYTPNVAAKK